MLKNNKFQKEWHGATKPLKKKIADRGGGGARPAQDKENAAKSL
jgi:hypothetical protein